MISGGEYRESLRRYTPRVFVDGQAIASVADAPALQPGINALAVTYDFALDARKSPLMTAVQTVSGRTVNRMLHINESAGDLLNKLEAVRTLCQETGCAQRYLAHDALNAIPGARANRRRERQHRYGAAASPLTSAACRTRDLALGIAMTDAKGDRSQRPHQQANPTSTCTSSSARPPESSSPAPRPSSPARPTCTSSWSCRAATWERPTPILPSAARCRSTRRD
jgi:4-hydroxybutyryl-CoA dehydratase/vinylacetyl-CoA-Delta-isomerase